MWRKFGFVFFPRLHDLQLLVLELFHFAFLFFMKNWYHRLIVIAYLNKRPVSIEPPPPLSNVFEINKPLEGLIEDLW